MNIYLSRIWSKTSSRMIQSDIIKRFITTANLYNSPAKKNKSSRSDDEEPLPYIGSNAASWQAKKTRTGGYDEMLWYQPYVISASLAIFLVYFCILREESDIDNKLEGSLFDHISGLEETQLSISYKYNKENGLDVTALEKRLKELGIDVKAL